MRLFFKEREREGYGWIGWNRIRGKEGKEREGGKKRRYVAVVVGGLVPYYGGGYLGMI